MADGADGASGARTGAQGDYWERALSATAGDLRRRRTVERSMLFDQEAERYDRYRPKYPEVVIEALLGPNPMGLEVLDVGCGTGVAARQMICRGARVLGVELAPSMADVTRRHGITVEVGAFEDWDAAGRTFALVTAAQAWHWLDMRAATAKAASLLRPGGRVGLIWNGGAHPDDLADTLEKVYAAIVPPGTHRLFRGYGANRSTDVRGGLDGVFEALAASPRFGPVTEEWFPWTRRCTRSEWLELLGSYSEYAALDTDIRGRLFDAIGYAVDDYGGSFDMNFETVLIAAARLD